MIVLFAIVVIIVIIDIRGFLAMYARIGSIVFIVIHAVRVTRVV